MSDVWDKNRAAAAESATESERDVLANGTAHEKVEQWLKLSLDDNGHQKAGASRPNYLSSRTL